MLAEQQHCEYPKRMTLHAAILAFIHWLLRLKASLVVIWIHLSGLVHFPAMRPRDSAGCIRRHLAAVNKLPVHISLIVVEDDISLSDIARLVVWSVAAGIAYISVYDHQGSCRQRRQQLEQQIVVHQKQMCGKKSKPSEACHVSSHQPLMATCDDNSLLLSEGNNEFETSNSSTSKSRVFILGPEDGRHKLADITRQLSCEVAAQRLSLDAITISYVDSIVRAKYDFPDPDLALKFGQLDCLVGFLPWHLRVTEIISVATHRGLQIQHFVDALMQFSRVEQRYGK